MPPPAFEPWPPLVCLPPLLLIMPLSYGTGFFSFLTAQGWLMTGTTFANATILPCFEHARNEFEFAARDVRALRMRCEPRCVIVLTNATSDALPFLGAQYLLGLGFLLLLLALLLLA